MKNHFDFYGIRMSIDAGLFKSASFYQEVLRGFEYFKFEKFPEAEANSASPSDAKNSTFTANIEIVLTGQDLGMKTKGLFSFRHSVAYGFKNRTATYPFQHAVKLNRKNAKLIQAEIHGRDPKVLKELLFQLINSLVGWELEKRGWHRLHAASFVESDKTRVLFLPSGGGKSYLTTKAIQRGHTCFSDEITMIDPSGLIRAWPIPIQLDDYTIDTLGLRRANLVEFPKMAFPPKYQNFIAAETVATAKPFEGMETPMGSYSFLLTLITGWGLPQIIEWNLRLDTLGDIFSIFINRFKFGLKVLLFKQLHAWTIADDRENSCGAVHISKTEST